MYFYVGVCYRYNFECPQVFTTLHIHLKKLVAVPYMATSFLTIMPDTFWRFAFVAHRFQGIHHKLLVCLRYRLV